MGDGGHDQDDAEPEPVVSSTSDAMARDTGGRSSMPASRSVVSVLLRELGGFSTPQGRSDTTVTGVPASSSSPSRTITAGSCPTRPSRTAAQLLLLLSRRRLQLHSCHRGGSGSPASS